MKYVTKAGAWSNGEVAYLAWDVKKKIPDCLGFMITRVHLSGGDKGARRILPTWVAFTDQNNPNWNEQDASVWPIQRFEWRDLTLRKSRDTTKVRPIDFKVQYEIVPIGGPGDGRKAIPPSATAPAKDGSGQPSYTGAVHKLYQIGDPFVTQPIDVTHDYGTKAAQISATFTNGILSTQNMVRQLEAVGKAPPKKVMAAAASGDKKTRVKANADKENHLLATLKKEIVKPDSKIRAFLTGDVFAFVTRLLDRAEDDGGEVYAALYELHDGELIKKLNAAMKAGRLHLILSSAGNYNPNKTGTKKEDRKPVLWDTENDAARETLWTLAKGKSPPRMFDRMFDTSARIGHNKFAVYVKDGKARAVMTGSTNWTETGLCTQSNNCIVVEDAALAGDYWDYWKRLREDKLPARRRISGLQQGKKIWGSAANNAVQGAVMRKANGKPGDEHSLKGKSGTVQLWASPNTTKNSVPSKNPAAPADLKVVYDLMDGAKKAILFACFLPGQSGRNNFIGEAVKLAQAKKDLLVMGAISDPSAMPNYKAYKKGEVNPDVYVDAAGKTKKLPPPAIWWPGGDDSRIVMIRAAAVKIPFGNLRPELLTAGHAIIHDKVIVIDPLEDDAVVITGSHNLGFKASYCNDDNMLIVRSNSDLAASYAVHILDLYDHYVMRARLEQNLRERLKKGQIKSYEEAAAESEPHGLLRTNDTWQDAHFKPNRPRTSLDYFLD